MKLLNEIKGVFKLPKKGYYLGKISHGTPYFYPRNFNATIITVRRLRLTNEKKYQEAIKEHPWLKESKRFTNLPMVRRCKDWIFKLFRNHYWLSLGWPMYIYWNSLGWKDKFETPRFEWSPAFYIFFFNWQFCIWWNAPDGDNDQYYEQILWWKNYANKDIKLAESTWGWNNYYTKESTWNKNYLL